LPNLDFEFLPSLNLMVVVQLEKTPTDAEWDAYLAALMGVSRGGSLPRCIVITGGAYPDHGQRERLIALTKGKPSRVAVISPATTVRFAASVLALINRNVKSYSPKEHDAAFSHVGLARADRAIVEACIERLRRELTSTPPVPVGHQPPAFAVSRRG
jgi:hypothetical protein